MTNHLRLVVILALRYAERNPVRAGLVERRGGLCMFAPALSVAIANQEIGVPRRADANQDNLEGLVSAVGIEPTT